MATDKQNQEKQIQFLWTSVVVLCIALLVVWNQKATAVCQRNAYQSALDSANSTINDANTNIDAANGTIQQANTDMDTLNNTYFNTFSDLRDQLASFSSYDQVDSVNNVKADLSSCSSSN